MKFLSLAILGCSILLAIPCMATTYKHIYNNSTSPWVVQFHPEYGSVQWVNKESVPTNGPWTIPAQSSIEIKYSPSSNANEGCVVITDHTGREIQFSYEGEGSDAQRGPGDSTPRFSHDGNTGSVAVNDKADGDLTMIGPVWVQVERDGHDTWPGTSCLNS